MAVKKAGKAVVTGVLFDTDQTVQVNLSLSLLHQTRKIASHH